MVIFLVAFESSKHKSRVEERRKTEKKDETWDTSGMAKLRECFSVFNERFSLANDAAGVAYIDSSVVGTKRSK